MHTEKTDEDVSKTMEIERELALVEAALYVAGRPLDLKELCSVLKTRSHNKAREFARTLMKEYQKRSMSLEILELRGDRFVLQLKPELTPLVKKLVKRPLLSTGPLKTLAYIAYRQPISQKRVADTRGHHAYGHLKKLRSMDLIKSERRGRSTYLRTTDHLADHFGLSHEPPVMKKQLKKVLLDKKPPSKKGQAI